MAALSQWIYNANSQSGLFPKYQSNGHENSVNHKYQYASFQVLGVLAH